MKMKGRAISGGKARSGAIVYPEPFSFLGGVDGSTGRLNVADGDISGKVFAFPNGKGSTVGSYVVYDLMVHGHAPAALINSVAETIVTTGAVISSVPMVDGIDISLIRDGDDVVVDGDLGEVELVGVGERTVAVILAISDGKVAMTRGDVDSHACPGRLVPPSCDLGEGDDAVAKATEAARALGFPFSGIRSAGAFAARGRHVVYHASLFVIECGGADPVPGFEWIDIYSGSEDIPDGVRRLLKRI